MPAHVLSTDVGGESVLLNLDTGVYYGLDAVVTRMWALLVGHGKVAPAHRALMDEYDVEEERLRQDLVRPVDELTSCGLLQIDAQ